MINVFVGLSNNQVKNYEALLPIIKGSKNILITSNSLKVDRKLFSKVLDVDQSFNNQSSSILSSVKNINSKIKNYKKLIKELKKYTKNKEITLYFTYVEDVLTNYLLFSFDKNLKGIVVEDGTLNYYYHSIKSLDSKKVYLKKILCAFYGLKFTIYKGHSSGIEYKHVTKQYVRSPELSFFPAKSNLLPYNKKNTVLTNSFLIIGQESYINEQGKELYIIRLKELFQIIKEHPKYATIHQVYYKPHRNGERINYKLLVDFFENKTVEVLSPDMPLEELYFNQISSKYIFSFDSSALLNIYLEAHDEIQKKIIFTVLLKYKKQLRSIFNKFNFNIVE